MAKVTVFFYDEAEKRPRRKRLKGETVSYAVEDGFVKIVVDNKIFTIKKENVISLDITDDVIED